MIDINGLAHVNLTVNNFERCRAFYKGLLSEFGMECVFDGDDFCYHVGARTAIGITSAAPRFAGEVFQQDRIGLHHVCFRARSKADVDAVHNLVKDLGATVVSPPGPGKWAPGYYYCLFEDPDGIRLEVNHVPGSGVLADDVTFAPGQDYR